MFITLFYSALIYCHRTLYAHCPMLLLTGWLSGCDLTTWCAVRIIAILLSSVVSPLEGKGLTDCPFKYTSMQDFSPPPPLTLCFIRATKRILIILCKTIPQRHFLSVIILIHKKFKISHLLGCSNHHYCHFVNGL